MPRFEIDHAILRYEHLTIVIEAEDAGEAETRARTILDEIPYASYEPGDISSVGDVLINQVTDDAELTDLDELL